MSAMGRKRTPPAGAKPPPASTLRAWVRAGPKTACGCGSAWASPRPARQFLTGVRAPPLREKRRPLIPRLSPRLKGLRAAGQVGNVPRIKLAVEAKTEDLAGLPADHRPPGQRSAVQRHRRSARKAYGAIQLGAAGREVEDLDRMPLAPGLEERRQRHRDAWVRAAVRKSGVVFAGGNGACHILPVAMA